MAAVLCSLALSPSTTGKCSVCMLVFVLGSAKFAESQGKPMEFYKYANSKY